MVEITVFDKVLGYHDKLVFELFKRYNEGTPEEWRVDEDIIGKALDNEHN